MPFKSLSGMLSGNGFFRRQRNINALEQRGASSSGYLRPRPDSSVLSPAVGKILHWGEGRDPHGRTSLAASAAAGRPPMRRPRRSGGSGVPEGLAVRPGGSGRHAAGSGPARRAIRGGGHGSQPRRQRRRGGSGATPAPLCSLSAVMAEHLRNSSRFPAEGRLGRGLVRRPCWDLADAAVQRLEESALSQQPAAEDEDDAEDANEREERILISEARCTNLVTRSRLPPLSGSDAQQRATPPVMQECRSQYAGLAVAKQGARTR